MFAELSPDKKSYVCGNELVPRADIVARFPGLEGRGEDVRGALASAYRTVHGCEVSHNDLHAYYMAYMDTERKLPEWVCKIFCKSQ